MNSTTSFPFTSLSMNCSMPMESHPFERRGPLHSAIYVSQKVPPTQEPFADSLGFWCIEGAFHLETVVLVKGGDLDNSAWRIWAAAPKLFLQLVYQGPQPTHIGDKHGEADAIRKPGAFGLGNALHVQKRLPDASLFALHEAIIRRIDAAHAGDEYEISGAHAQTPGARRRDRSLRSENANAASGVHPGVPVCRASACSTPPIWPLSAS